MSGPPLNGCGWLSRRVLNCRSSSRGRAGDHGAGVRKETGRVAAGIAPWRISASQWGESSPSISHLVLVPAAPAQAYSQQVAGPRQPPLDCADRTLKQPGDLLVALAFDVSVQHQHAVLRGQAIRRQRGRAAIARCDSQRARAPGEILPPRESRSEVWIGRDVPALGSRFGRPPR